MYKIIGANQAQYGPVSADQLRQWIAEGRADANTQAQLEGTTEWKPLREFPEFAGLFAALPAAPPPGYGAPVSADMARTLALQQVNGPAIGLTITAALGLIAAFGGIFLSLFNISMGNSMMDSGNPAGAQMMQLFSGVVGLVLRVIEILVCVLILYGALKMRKLENYGLGMAASILAMLPCLSPCCLIGLPIGIWALIVITKPEVKNQFT